MIGTINRRLPRARHPALSCDRSTRQRRVSTDRSPYLPRLQRFRAACRGSQQPLAPQGRRSFRRCEWPVAALSMHSARTCSGAATDRPNYDPRTFGFQPAGPHRGPLGDRWPGQHRLGHEILSEQSEIWRAQAGDGTKDTQRDKQATEGDVNIPRPSSRQVVEYAKWKAWSRMKGMSPIDAQKLYVESLVQLLSEVCVWKS